MLENILDNLGIEKDKRCLYSLDKNGGLIVPTPEELFNAGFINESDFTYQEWLDKKEIMTEPTEIELLKQELITVQEALDFIVMNGGI